MASATSSTTERPCCSICQEDILPQANVSILSCAHQYHRDCLQPWLDANHDTCPLDRARITSINGTAYGSGVEQPEVVGYAPVVAIANPLQEARGPWQATRVIRNPLIHSRDPVVRTAAKTQAVAFSMLFGRRGDA